MGWLGMVAERVLGWHRVRRWGCIERVVRERRGSKASVILTEAEISRCKDFIHCPFIHIDTHHVSLINLFLYCITKESGRIELILFISLFLFLYVTNHAEPAGILAQHSSYKMSSLVKYITSILLIACLIRLTDMSFNYKSATTPHKDNTYLAAYILNSRTHSSPIFLYGILITRRLY